MEILLFLALFIIGGLLNFIKNAGFKFVFNVALVYIFIVLFISLSSWMFYCAAFKNASVLKTLSFQVSLGDSLGHLILGYLMANILIALTSAETDNYDVKKNYQLNIMGPYHFNQLLLYNGNVLEGRKF